MRFPLRTAAFALAVFAVSACGKYETSQTATVSDPAPPAATQTAPATTPAAPAEAPSATPQAAWQCLPGAQVLCPVDEGASDPSFARFRSEMLAAVRSRDAAALAAFIDPQIRTSFGDGGGLEEFRQQWKPESASSELWKELESILTLGGKFLGDGESRSFWAPYVYAAWPDPYDSFMHVTAVKADVPIYARPDRASEVKTSVSWEILELGQSTGQPPGGWQRVRTAGGVDGWASDDDVRSPIGYRAGFGRQGDRWRMNALVAGD